MYLNVSKSRTSTTDFPLGNLFQCYTIHMVNIFFLISNLHWPSFSFKPLSLVLLQQTLLNNLSPSFLRAPFQYWKTAVRSSQSPLQAEQPQLAQPFLTGEVFHPSNLFMPQFRSRALLLVLLNLTRFPLLDLVQIPLNGIPSLRHVNASLSSQISWEPNWDPQIMHWVTKKCIQWFDLP